MIKRDREATIAAQFEDPGSYITPDGREVLKGKDWVARKYQVWCRGNGKCEQIIEVNPGSYTMCRNEMQHVHHIIKRSKSRDDREENLIGLCVKCHELEHPEKQPQWTRVRPGVGPSSKS